MSWKKKPRQDLQNSPEKILSAALNYLARREYCSHDLRQRLLRRGAEPEALEQVLSLLTDRGYLSDIRFAECFVRYRRDFYPCGAAKIHYELRSKGFDTCLIDDILAAEYDEEQQRAALSALLLKAARQLPQDDQEQLRKYRVKIMRRMMGRGFSQAMIIEEINDIFAF